MLYQLTMRFNRNAFQGLNALRNHRQRRPVQRDASPHSFCFVVSRRAICQANQALQKAASNIEARRPPLDGQSVRKVAAMLLSKPDHQHGPARSPDLATRSRLLTPQQSLPKYPQPLHHSDPISWLNASNEPVILGSGVQRFLYQQRNLF